MTPTFPTFVFTDLNTAVRDALDEAFRGWTMGVPNPDVIVPLPQDFRLAFAADAVVSPANAFGLMDGGFDAALTRLFGPGLQARAQSHIERYWSGEQPIGTAFIVQTHNPECPNVIHAPTMRYPADIRGTLNVYYAMKAIVEEAVGMGYKRVICPGLGTLSGHMDPNVAARQMEGAYAVVRKAWSDRVRTDCTPQALTQEQKWGRAVSHERFVESLRGPAPDVPAVVTPEFYDSLAETHGR